MSGADDLFSNTANLALVYAIPTDSAQMSTIASAWLAVAKTNIFAAEQLTAILHARATAEPIANRLYYSVFQAVVSRLVNQGHKPVEFGSGPLTQWPHLVTTDERALRVVKLYDHQRLFKKIKDERVRADYHPGGQNFKLIRGYVDDILDIRTTLFELS